MPPVSQLKTGFVYEGHVEALNLQDQTYTVNVEGDPISQCQSAIGMFSALLGIKSTYRIPQGTRVLLCYGKRPYIVGCIPNDPPDEPSHLGRSATGSGIRNLMQQLDPSRYNELPPHDASQDLFDGEYEMGMNQAGFIRFMTFMASIGVEGRSQIQFHLLRDLVRLVSGYFEHFSAFGDEVIMDDGRVSIEINGTPYHHERMGLLSEGQPLACPADDFDGEAFDPKITGRWRYTRYLGFLGDLLNEWFTDPPAVAGSMAEEALRSGKARFHVGGQGEVLLQSVTEVAIERVVRIPVPIRMKHPDDPEGVLREEFANLDKQYLKNWPKDGPQNAHHTVFFLRDYARWLAQYHSLARIHQLAAKGEEFSVPSEEETPEPATNCAEPDRPVGAWREAYATIRILRDGSIVNLDGYHNCWSSGPQGICVDTPSHYRAWVGGDMSLVVGGSFFLRARRHIEMVADFGGLLMKARTALKALVERGAMLLVSEHDPDNAYSPAEGDPDPEIDPQGYGIIVSSPNAGVFHEAGGKLKLLQKGESESMNFEVRGKSRIDLRGEATLSVRKNLLVKLADTLFLRGGRILGNRLREILFENLLKISGGSVEANSLFGRTVRSVNGFSGGQSENVARADYEDPDLSLEDSPPEENPAAADAEMRFRFLAFADYLNPTVPGNIGRESLPGDTGALFEGLGQQRLRLDSPEGYAVWEFQALLPGARVSSGSQPFPGIKRWKTASLSGGALHTPSPTAPSAMGGYGSGSLSTNTIAFRYLTRS